MVQAGRAFTDHDRADGLPVAVVSRSALGARGRDLSALMFRGELPPVAIGICSGLASAYGGAPYLFATPFETDPRYATIYLAVGAGLLSVAALAIYLPARGARSVNPHEALSL
jgi:non-ribosomal peptide synthetase component F